MEAAARMEAAVVVAARCNIGDHVGGHRWPLSAIMLTEAGKRGRLQGGELSCGGLEGGEGGDEGVELGSGGLGGGEGGGKGGGEGGGKGGSEGGGEGGVLGFGGL
jgi:hypothetical protein